MLNLIFGPHTSLVRQRKIRHRVFTSPITRLIRTFRVAIEQWRQKNVRKFSLLPIIFDAVFTAVVVCTADTVYADNRQ